MAIYTFETITDAQAASYNSANDSLIFSNQGAHSSNVVVSPVVTAGSATAPPGLAGVVIFDPVDGLAKSFGPGLANETATFSDGSVLFVGQYGVADSFTAPAAGSQAIGMSGIAGGTVDDTLTGAAGNDLFYGNAGDDKLIGGGGNDTLYAGQGNDQIDIGTGKFVHANGNLGDDTISGTGVAGGGDTLNGGQGQDSISSGLGADSVNGDLGNDIIANTGGNDTIFGGDGNDSITGTAADSEQIYGNMGDDTLVGGVGAGNDTIFGGQGNDNITAGGTSGLTLHGDNGNDSITLSGDHHLGGAWTDINGNAGDDTLAVGDIGAGAYHGGDGNDVITSSTSAQGAANSKAFFGDLGSDNITDTGLGNDTLIGGGGDDTLSGGVGVVGAGGVYAVDAGDGNDVVKIEHGAALAGTGSQVDTIVGGAGDDHVTLSGASGVAASVDLGDGNDSVLASAWSGNDTLFGGAGDDTIDAHAHVAGGAGAAARHEIIDGGAGNDVLIASNPGAAGNGGDSINGGDGADTIISGTGKDVIFGGSGADKFVFNGNATVTSDYTLGSQDQIKDWESQDHLHFQNSGVDMAAGTGTNYKEESGGIITDYASAQTVVGADFAVGYKYVAVQVAGDVVVFADTNASGTLNAGDDAVVLVGRSLSDIDSVNIV
jgi:Ca2+-binding RTX toxin-like protein